MKLASLYEDIAAAADRLQACQAHTYKGLTKAEIDTAERDGFTFYRGKVRDILLRDQTLEIIHTDRLTAFDKEIAFVPGKGALLSEMSVFWFEILNEIVPTHFVRRLDERRFLAKATNPVKLEVIVRGYLAGSLLRSYQAGERIVNGVRLPDGLTSYSMFPKPLITPSTKAAVFEHDVPISAEEAVAAGICSQKEWDDIANLALRVFAKGQQVFAERGWVLADTKYEFGRTDAGEIILIDEAHTPDSSRLWVGETLDQRLSAGQAPDMFDKEIVRQWLIKHGFSGEGDVPDVPVELILELGRSYRRIFQDLTRVD